MAQANPIQVQNYLRGAQYPASREHLLECARQENAPQEVMEALESISDREYQSPADLSLEFRDDASGDDSEE